MRRNPATSRPVVHAGLLRGWRFAAIFALLVALGGCAWLDARQRQLALRPTPAPPAAQGADAAWFRAGDQPYMLEVPADPALSPGPGPDRLALWWLPHADPAAPALLYLHGTFRNLYGNRPKIQALRELGFSVLAVDYRGWGQSTPLVPTEDSIAADAQVAWRELLQRQPLPARRVIYGHSMGGAVAVRLASNLRGGTDYAALVLESTFTRLPDVAGEAGFWGSIAAAITTLEFDSLSRIGRIDAPLWMLHGSADQTVPVQLGRRLRDAAPPGVRWVEIPGGTHSRLHSEAPEMYRQTFRELMRQIATPETPAPSAHRP
jgi:pimeloyl-ACP methyl ester carboxylesterase